MKLRTFTLNAAALAAAHCSGFLALHESALGGIFSLAEHAPPASGAPAGDREQVRVVTISGPLQTRAEEHLCGYADGYDAIVSRVGAAFASEDVDAVVLDVLSPGGDAVGSLEAARRLRQMAQESGKPLLAAVTSGYSAAYALASAAESIYVIPSGGVGSIGTIAVHVSEARALVNEGLDVTILRSHPTKAMGHPAEQLSEEARAEIQKIVDDLGASFRALVAEHRGLTAADLDELGARTRHGAAAVNAGLADGVGSLEDVVSLAAARTADRARKGYSMTSSKLSVANALPPVLREEPRCAPESAAVNNDAAMAAEMGVDISVARLARDQVQAALRLASLPAPLAPPSQFPASLEEHRPAQPRAVSSDERMAFEMGVDLSIVRLASEQVQAAQRPPAARPLPSDAAMAAEMGVDISVARLARDQVQAALKAQG